MSLLSSQVRGSTLADWFLVCDNFVEEAIRGDMVGGAHKGGLGLFPTRSLHLILTLGLDGGLVVVHTIGLRVTMAARTVTPTLNHAVSFIIGFLMIQVLHHQCL